MFRRDFLVGGLSSGLVLAAATALRAQQPVDDAAAKLVTAARRQVGVTRTYDAAYTKLGYPGGDVPRERGVCTDVIIRAYRDALDVDLQVLVHEDMRRAFSAYPALWGLSRTDRNIDHRRVPNLQAFFRRADATLPISNNAADYRPGDIVSQMLPGNLPHIGIVADERTPDRSRPLVVHNIGAGARMEDVLFAYPITGHYRYKV
ncbi:DUF1287 domain-containing protein [Shinella sp. H4-D48]|uniref:DUF1287 domain-containing protein n=1 Tax=Shinella sp. H4-D48 TaxID=2925841 RepID=UPI001F53BE2F|nr:DUF1287 domain-containing protein [Shinella sp. H4-D48]UNK38391.1 DUF1287 domain-containing protein [Shinella sp. H4-D48]